MKILSIDIGIKNLAYCLIETTGGADTFNIIKWDVINLCEESPICQYIITNKNKKKPCDKKPCDKKSCLFRDDTFYCRTHAKKMNCLFQTPENTIKPNSKIDEIKKIADTYKIIYEPTVKKSVLKHKVEEYIEENIFKSVAKSSANSLSLIDIGISLAKKLPLHLKNNIEQQDIDKVIIENQISPLANRMKTIQGMVTQYFIMNNITDIHFISAINKLKPFIQEKMNYSERKKTGINITKHMLQDNNTLNSWSKIFSIHKKKDDLADCLLQGIWFLLNRKYITIDNIIIKKIQNDPH